METIIALAKKFVEEPEKIEWGEDTSIVSDMELTSMELFSFIAQVEAELEIRIKERELNRIETLGDLAELVQRLVKR